MINNFLHSHAKNSKQALRKLSKYSTIRGKKLEMRMTNSKKIQILCVCIQVCDTDLWLAHNSSHTWPGLYGTSAGSHSLCGGDDDGGPLSCCWSMSRGGHGPTLSLSPSSISLSSPPLSLSQHVELCSSKCKCLRRCPLSPLLTWLKAHTSRPRRGEKSPQTQQQSRKKSTLTGGFFLQLKKHSSKLILILNMLLFLCLSVFPLFSFWC